MKKIVILMLVMLLGLSVTILGVEDENNSDIIKPPFKSFSLIFASDKENPDIHRDGLPWAEYDPADGWTFYKVEAYKGEETVYNHNSWFRLELSIDDKPIKLDPSDNKFLTELRRCFMTFNPRSYIDGNLEQGFLRIIVTFEPVNIDEGNLCGIKKLYQKNNSTNHFDYLHGGGGYITEDELNGYNIDNNIIAIIDNILQLERWCLENDSYVLIERCAMNPEMYVNHEFYAPSLMHSVRYTSIFSGYLELFPDKNKIIYKGNEYEYHRYPRFPHCEMRDDNIAINIFTLGEILGCNVHSWNFETRKSYFDKVHMDYYHINLMDEDDSFRRLTFEFDNKTANLHRPIYEDKTIELPFAPYLNKDRKKYKCSDNIDMMVPLITVLDILELDYYYRPMNNSVLISLDKDW